MSKWRITPTPSMKSMTEGAVPKGKRFELMVEFVDEGKEWCITSVEGVPAPGYEGDEEEPKATMPDTNGGEFGKQYMDQMKGGY